MIHERVLSVNKEATLLQLAMDNLPPQIRCESELTSSLDLNVPYSDAELTLQTHTLEVRFDVEIKHIHRKESLAKLLPYCRSDTLLVCNRLSDFLADFCSDNAINFVDASGNARISNGGFQLWIEGKQAQDIPAVNTTQARPGVGFMKLVFALLVDEKVLHLPYREIANLANISLGMVSKGFQYLYADKLISQGDRRFILDQHALYRLWIEHYRTVLRPKLGGIRLDAPADWRDIPVGREDLWGGEVAADELTHYLQPYDLQLFTFMPLQQKLAVLQARPNQNGRLWLVPAFWGKELHIGTQAKALLAVAELVASKNSRNMEVAEQINEQYLHIKAFVKAGV